MAYQLVRKGAKLPFLLYMVVFTYDKRAPHLYRNNNKDYNVGVEGEDSCSKQGGKRHD